MIKEGLSRQLVSLDDVIVPPLMVLSAGSAPSDRWKRVDYLGGVNEKQVYGRTLEWTDKAKQEFAAPFLNKHRIEIRDVPSNQ